MLHLTTEVGKPGKKELERRHFSHLTNRPSEPLYRVHGRRFIDHGYCHMDDSLWRPHNIALAVDHADDGPDWKSRLRYIPHPSNESQRLHENEKWPNTWFQLRTFPGHNRTTEHEWTAYPEGYHWGKICVFDGLHKASQRGRVEVQYDDVLGNSKKEFVIDKRNGLWVASPGDKSYKSVEYSPGFHKVGSTRPIVNFGSGRKKSIVPLQALPPIPVEPYHVKESRRRHEQESLLVTSLEDWRPATPLVPLVKAK